MRAAGDQPISKGPGPISFICVAALCPRKGIDILLRAFERVLKRSDPGAVRLLLLGPELTPRYRRDVERSALLSDHVEFLGPVSADAVKQHIDEADVLVLASRFDGWGMVLNEAASLGLPLVATDSVGAAHHLIDTGVNGFRVPAGDVDAIANAMYSYVENPEAVKAHGMASLRVFERWTPRANTQRLLEILDALATGSSGGSQ